MKKVLITGANSYIGTSFEEYINKNHFDDYSIDTIDMIDETWRDKDFTIYDSVFHVAGIVHQKETRKNTNLYYLVNRNLAIECAKKAKEDGVKQFIFLSSMSVYGMDTGIITKNTIPSPKSHYGKSKLGAEQELKKIASNSFKIAILRPPMVYGEGCKGNYQSIVKIVEKVNFFPMIYNQRSMINIDNLTLFIKGIIDDEESGIFFPQDKEYIVTHNMAKDIAGRMGKKIYISRLLGLLVLLFKPFSRKIKKAFGTLIYKI